MQGKKIEQTANNTKYIATLGAAIINTMAILI